MKILFFALTLFCAGHVSAQINIKDQPGNAYFDFIKNQCIGKIPSQSVLLAMKPMSIPTTFMDTLRKYDWVELGGYGYHDKEYYNYFSAEEFSNEKDSQYQFNLFRVLTTGERADFSLHKFHTNDSYVTTTSFTKNNCQTYDKLKVYKTNTFLQTAIFGEISYTHILSWKNGILIIDITKTGKLIDTKTMYRTVYKAVPKKFEWGFSN